MHTLSPIHISRTLLFCTVAVLVWLCSSCSNDAEDLYAHNRAFLKFTPVSGVTPLFTALNSTGQWCTIRLDGSNFTFAGSNGSSTTYPLTAEIKNYGQPEYICGFIVGKPSIPDMNMSDDPVAYDLACPACYTNSMRNITLTLTEGETATCHICNRVYDLANGGMVKEGGEGKSLFRYHLTYTNNLLIVMN